MIKSIVFDMDGVLIDARDWHFDALNMALEVFGVSISPDQHLRDFDGLPTAVKLKKLSERGIIPFELHDIINATKQERTLRIAAQRCFPNPSHVAMLSYLKNQNFKLGLATNSIRRTTLAMLNYGGIQDFFDSILTNEDVAKPKPNDEIYTTSARILGHNVSETLVVEDNRIGIAAAKAAGCHVLEVRDPEDVHLDRILDKLGKI
jgi:beta-phosphoglucomutase